MATIDRVLQRIDDGLDESLSRLFDLLRIRSISTDPAYAGDCRKAAEWLAGELTGIGIASKVRDTTGHPMVVGHAANGQAGPHALFYGHYDVQPVDPVDLWNADPFEPHLVTRDDGSRIIVARGACDDKGQLMTFVEAARAWIAENGALPVPVSVLIEGEEESGSPSLEAFLTENREELSVDFAMICDTGMWDRDTPAITTMLRGMVSEEIFVTAADKDLHSGLFGGAARNPNRVLARVIADLHDADGRIMVPGFYDGVVDMPADVTAMWAELGFDEKAFLGGVGLSEPAGESDRSVLEQIWTRPTCDVNGMSGGYTGDGFKTVIPSQASAKISFRLVAGQDPVAIRDNFRDFVRARIPADCSVSFTGFGCSPALQLPMDSGPVRKGRAALAAEWGRPAAIIGIGGSIPIAGDFKTMLGMDSLMIGFGLDDDQIHSPNEKYDLQSFHKGIRSWARVLDELAR